MKNSQGGCLCGEVRYEVTEEPMALFCCHCTECQTTNGSSFVLALRVPYAGITVTKGTAKLYERPEADGQVRNVGRCPRCLTALWSERLQGATFQTLYAGTLDASNSLRPVAHIWTDDAQPWIVFEEGTLKYGQNAPDMQLIFDAWRRKHENQVLP